MKAAAAVKLPGSDLVVRLVEPEDSSRIEGLVILCHGYGAPGTDLVGLAGELCSRKPEIAGRVAFAFPQAPLEPPELAMFGGRAWWNLDMGRIEAMMRAGQMRDLANDVPEGMASARRKLRATVEALVSRFQLPMSRTILGGFSQGAMLTTETTLHLEEAPAGLAILSGTLVNMQGWEKLAPKRAGLAVLQAHGQRDPVLPFSGAEALRDLLVAAGLNVDFRPFPGEHTIPWDVLGALGSFVQECFFDAPPSL